MDGGFGGTAAMAAEVAPAVMGGTRLARAGQLALTGAKFVGGSLLTGVVVGTQVGLITIAAVGVSVGIYKGSEYVTRKVGNALNRRKVEKHLRQTQGDAAVEELKKLKQAEDIEKFNAMMADFGNQIGNALRSRERPVQIAE